MKPLRTVLAALAAAFAAVVHAAPGGACPPDCAPRIGIVSAFGQEADILVEQTRDRRTVLLNGNRFTTGTLRGNRVVIVLSGVSMINSTMVTQLMLDHFRVERLVMSGIAGGLDPARHVGDVTVPERWAMPMEVYWNRDNARPGPCGQPGDVSCLGLKLAEVDGKPVAPLSLGASAPTGLFPRDNHVMNAANAPRGEFRFDYPVDAAMLEVARAIRPALRRCGPKATGPDDAKQCVKTQPELVVGGRGVSGTAFLANPEVRRWLYEELGARTVEMETAALAHVAYANGVPYIAFRSLSDLAGAEALDPDAITLFTSGLAETNEAAVTLAFLEAWGKRRR